MQAICVLSLLESKLNLPLQLQIAAPSIYFQIVNELRGRLKYPGILLRQLHTMSGVVKTPSLKMNKHKVKGREPTEE